MDVPNYRRAKRLWNLELDEYSLGDICAFTLLPEITALAYWNELTDHERFLIEISVRVLFPERRRTPPRARSASDPAFRSPAGLPPDSSSRTAQAVRDLLYPAIHDTPKH